MTAISHVFEQQLTAQTQGAGAFATKFTSSGTDWTGSAEYIMWVWLTMSGSTGPTRQYEVQVRHGTTVFPGSLQNLSPNDLEGNGIRYHYFYQFKYTPNATPEDVTIQIRAITGGQTCLIDNITIMALKLDDISTADWVYGEDDDTASPVTHNTTFLSKSNISITPTNDNHDWLVVMCTNTQIDKTTVQYEGRIRLVSDGVEQSLVPLYSEEPQNGTEIRNRGLHRVFTLNTADTPHVFEVQVRDDEVTSSHNDHVFSSIFAIRLNIFEDHSFVWDESEFTFATDGVFEDMETFTLNPTTSPGPFFIFGQSIKDMGAADKDAGISLEIGGTVTPVGIESELSNSYDATDELVTLILTKETITGSTAVDLRGSAQTVSEAKSEDRSLVAFSLELAAAQATALTYTVDALLLAPTTLTFTVDALLVAPTTLTYTVDALLLAPTTLTFTVDALLTGPATQTFTVDALLSAAANTLTFTVDALLLAPVTLTYTVDALLLAPTTLAFTVDALLLAQANALTFAVDALLSGATALTYTVDALLLAQANALTYTVDALLSGSTALTYTVDALLLAQASALTFTVDAFLVAAINVLTFTVDAFLARPSVALTYTVDALLLAQANVLTYTVDALLLAQASALTYTTDAMLQVQDNAVTFAVDAVTKFQYVIDLEADLADIQRRKVFNL